MVEDPIMPSELGAYTNNSPNKEGIKKLCEKINEGGGGTTYTAGDNIQISAENVISATDTKYTAGTGIEISEEDVVSCTIKGRKITYFESFTNLNDAGLLDHSSQYEWISKKEFVIEVATGFGSSGALHITRYYYPKGISVIDGWSATLPLTVVNCVTSTTFNQLNIPRVNLYPDSSGSANEFKFTIENKTNYYQLSMKSINKTLIYNKDLITTPTDITPNVSVNYRVGVFDE